MYTSLSHKMHCKVELCMNTFFSFSFLQLYGEIIVILQIQWAVMHIGKQQQTEEKKYYFLITWSSRPM